MSSYLHEVRYGVLVALATLGWNSLEYAVGLHTKYIAYHPLLTNLYFVIPVFLMWRALEHRRDVLEKGRLDWWQGLTSGMVISVVAGALGAPSTWVFIRFVNPKFFSTMIEFSVERGYYQRVDHAEAYYNFAGYAIQSTLMPIVFGVFASAILTAIARWQIERRTKTPTAS